MDPQKITALRALLAAGTPGPWRQGFVTGQCRKPEHRDGHPGPRGVNPCVYEYRIVADDEIQRCYISVEPNVTLIGSDDHGPILSEADAALIVAAHEALPELLDEVERLRREVNECDTFHGAVTAQIAHYRRQATSADNDRDTAIAERDRLRALVEEARERGSRLAEHVSDQWLIADAGDADRIDAIRDEAKGAK